MNIKRFWINYRSTIILLSGIIIGGIIGVVAGQKATVLKPIGDLFLNLLFMVLVPLVFFSVTSAISGMSEMNRLGKILKSIILVFIVTALISAVIAFIGALIVNPTKGLNQSMFTSLIKDTTQKTTVEKVGILEQLVKTITVSDFSDLMSKANMLQIIIFSILIGIGTVLGGEKARPIANFTKAGSVVMMRVVGIIMKIAPVGLGCYFATVVGELGPQILSGYISIFLLYIFLTVFIYVVLFSLYAYVSGGKKALAIYWKNIIAPTVTALATCSSAASIPVNMESSKKMGVPDDIAETVIPLGANIHKDGSVVGGVMKIVFLFGLFGKDMFSIQSIVSVIVVSFLVGAVMGAIPGGGMMGEMLILSVYGLSPQLLPIIAVISTIIDAPATVLNSAGNTVCSMLVSRLVDGKKWLKD